MYFFKLIRIFVYTCFYKGLMVAVVHKSVFSQVCLQLMSSPEKKQHEFSSTYV